MIPLLDLPSRIVATLTRQLLVISETHTSRGLGEDTP